MFILKDHPKSTSLEHFEDCSRQEEGPRLPSSEGCLGKNSLSGKAEPSCAFHIIPALGTDHIPRPVLDPGVDIPEKIMSH